MKKPTDPTPRTLSIKLPTRRATRELAGALAQHVAIGDLIVLTGALGAGKTFLVRALCRALGLPTEERVTSPTFALMQELDTEPKLVHADVYRLGQGTDIYDLGLDAARADAAVIVEWGEPFIDALGGDALHVRIQLSPRCAQISSTGPRSAETLSALERTLQAPSQLNV